VQIGGDIVIVRTERYKVHGSTKQIKKKEKTSEAPFLCPGNRRKLFHRVERKSVAVIGYPPASPILCGDKLRDVSTRKNTISVLSH
jgi:hypothetical protein